MFKFLENNLIATRNVFKEKGLPAFKADQLFGWVYKKAIFDFDKMSSFSSNDKIILNEFIEPWNFSYEKIVGSTTIKILINTEEGLGIETVVIPSSKGNTLCVSTQLGCPLKCVFCETGQSGFIRNLAVAEIIKQYLVARKEGYEIDRIVYMGMGEPLLNLDSVIKATEILNHEKGANIGIRRFTVSTAGIIPGIKHIMDSGYKFNLALSLHAPNNKLRSKLMPVNEKYNIVDLFKALSEYRKVTGRRVTLEYVLLQGINDSEKEAEQLIALVRGTDFHVNLIPYNHTSSKYARSRNMDKFFSILQESNINVTKRKSEGEDINAACGMLSGKSDRQN